MKILVLGASGFIGTSLVQALNKNGDEVIEHTSQKGDILKADVLDQYKGIECVYHLAARTFVPESWENPAGFLKDNIIGTINVLEYCRKNKTKMVFASTYLYGKPLYLPIDEKHVCSCISPYHLSKKNGEDLCKFYSEHFQVDVAIVRPFNVYGIGQRREYLISKIFWQLMDETKDTIEVLDLQPKRDYIYIDDLTEMLVLLKDKINGCEVYNLGSGCSYSVKEVIDIVQAELGTHKKIVETGIRRKNEVMDCVADIDKFLNMVGKVRLHTLREGIHEWHLESMKQK